MSDKDMTSGGNLPRKPERLWELTFEHPVGLSAETEIEWEFAYQGQFLHYGDLRSARGSLKWTMGDRRFRTTVRCPEEPQVVWMIVRAWPAGPIHGFRVIEKNDLGPI